MRKVRNLLSLLLVLTVTIFAQGKRMHLDDCIEVAMKNNPEMRIAEKQLNYSQEAIRGSYSGILPYVSFSTSANRHTQGPSEYYAYGQRFESGDTTSYYYNAGLGVSQNIFDGGKWWNNIKLAKTGYNNTSVERDYTRQVIIANVTEKFYEVLKAQELLKVYELALENSRQQLSKTEEMFKIGQVAKKDLFKAQVQEGSGRLKVIQQGRNLNNAVLNLNIAMGIEPDSEIEVYEEDYKSPVLIGKEIALELAYGNNRVLRSLELQKESSFLQYKIAKGDRYPALSASFSYYRGGSEFSRTYSEFDKWWNTSLGVNLSFPLFEGFHRETNIQQKLINYQIYNDRMDKQKMEIQNQVQELLFALETYRDMLEINELTIQSAEEDLRLAQEMYRLNSATLLEVLDAQVALTRSRVDLITTRYDAKITEVRLALVIGTL
jgi:outer membrane protein TolC